jgi:hypothetical protein
MAGWLSAVKPLELSVFVDNVDVSLEVRMALEVGSSHANGRVCGAGRIHAAIPADCDKLAEV